MNIKAVIIDDVKKAIQNLEKDLKIYCPDIEIIGSAEGVVSGIRLIRSVKPELVFLDIQMNDGSGFDLLDLVGEENMTIIFVTAFNEHALQAIKYSAIDYLLKPVDPDELVKAVARVKKTKQSSATNVQVLKEHLSLKNKTSDVLALNTQEKIHVVKLQDIIRCESQGNYTEFYFAQGKKIVVTNTLKDYEELLKERNFFRVHQSHLVNTKHILEFIKSQDALLMSDKQLIPVSVRKRTEVVQMLEEL